jgi:hypothetical protein
MSSPGIPSARPIFIVGSPRSGTSILTWCLGQHSNILVQEESSWIGPLTIQLEIGYRLGTARGERSQLSALGVERGEYFAAFGEAIDRMILQHRNKLEQRSRDYSRKAPSDPPDVRRPPSTSGAFQIARQQSDPKRRWVDGTPEYSFYIHPLAKLFPQARFIHVLRDGAAVVRSMLAFERTGGPPLVQNEQAAYDYWLRTVRACLEAERAYGSAVICRLRHSDLIDQPELSLRRVLDFLGEPFEPNCLEPLRQRINSSDVPAEFDPVDPATDPKVRESARQLYEESLQLPPQIAPHSDAMSDLEQRFSLRADELAERLAQPLPSHP